MKLQIDLDNKTIKIDQNIKIKDFIKTVKDLRPKDWADYTLEANAAIINWYNPIPYWSITDVCGVTTGSPVYKPGITTSTNVKVNPATPFTYTSNNVLNYEINN